MVEDVGEGHFAVDRDGDARFAEEGDAECEGWEWGLDACGRGAEDDRLDGGLAASPLLGAECFGGGDSGGAFRLRSSRKHDWCGDRGRESWLGVVV